MISLVAVHCVCHRLALACTDTKEELAVIKEVETKVTQLWKIFENSPKKLAAYLKVQEEMKQLTLGAKANKRIGKQIKKACKTWWLSFDNAIAAVCSELPSILQTLHQLKADPSCYSLLKKLMKVEKIGTIYILCEVLPVLSDLSRVFQSLFARQSSCTCWEQISDKEAARQFSWRRNLGCQWNRILQQRHRVSRESL